MEKPYFSIVIVNYNAGEMLSNVMSALSQQTFQDFEVIVIDNNSADESWRATENKTFPCHLIRLDKNIGFSAANNQAIFHHVHADWVFLLNPDAYPEPDCLEIIAKNIALSPNFDCFACTLIDANHPVQLDGLGDNYHISGLHWRHAHGSPCTVTPTQPVEVFSACAAAAIYRTTAFRQLNGFDESYFAYSEDVDLGFRLRLTGGACLLLPDAKVHHVGSGITGRSSEFSIYHGHRNLTWTFFKNIPTPLMPILLPVHLLMILAVGLKFSITGHFKSYVRAKWDAFRQLGPQLIKRKKIQNIRVCSCFDLLCMMSWLPRNHISK